MANLVYCRACRKRVSEEAVQELKGELFCPKCYGPLVAKLKEQKERKKQAEASAPPAPTKAAASAQAPAPAIGAQKLAAKATGVVGARQVAGVRGVPPQPEIRPVMPQAQSNLPDLPQEFLLQTSSPRGGGAGFGTEALGKGIYLALVGGALFAVYLFVRNADGSASWPAVIFLGMTAVVGFFALLAGIFNLIKGGETRKQICGILAMIAGLALTGWGGTRCVTDLNKVKIGGGIDVGQTESKPEPKTEGKQPEPKPETKPETKPENKPVTGGPTGPGSGLDLVAVKPKPEDQTPAQPEVKPALRPEDQLKAEIRALLPGAAAIEAPALGLGGPLKKLSDLPSQPLTAVVLLSRQLPGLKPDIELTAGGANKTSAELAEVMRVGDYVSVLRNEFIGSVSILLLDGGERISGEVKVNAALYQAAFPFEARRHEGKWRIESFTLRNSARKVTLEGDKWRLTETPSDDPAVRFVRALGDLTATELPAAISGVVPTAKQLMLYGELRLPGKPAAQLAANAPGVVLGTPGATRTADALAEVKKDTGWLPLALLVSGGRGPLLAMPAITPEALGDQAKLLVLTIVKKADKPGAYELVLSKGGMRFPADNAGLGEFVGKLTLLSRVPNLPVRIEPNPEAPVSVLVAVVDACIRARAQFQLMSIDPTPLSPAPAPAPEPEKK